MPYDKELRPSKKSPEKKKLARGYDESEGNLEIWYKASDQLNDSSFGTVLKALVSARGMVDKSIELLTKEKNTKLVQDVLNYHFRGVKTGKKIEEDYFQEIVEAYGYIREGLNQQVILCLSKNLHDEVRASTRAETDLKPGRIHLNRNLLTEHPTSIARTIVHEAAHAFAERPGDEKHRPEVYEHDKDDRYLKQLPEDAINCADSYAWAALSFHFGFVVTSDRFIPAQGSALEDT